MKITFRMAAWCAAAGRDHNEDNFQLKDNLANPDWGYINTDEVISLSDKGALMVVCDGMGGMKAGEVASDMAVNTIKEWFAADRLSQQVTASPDTIMQYIGNAIVAADERIKAAGRQNREYEGMGSTIVLAWIFGKNVYVGWCGDSRAYRFNPAFGLKQLSRDHSYVQELVDRKKLSEDLAFDHPDSNIITRSLGDMRQKAQPDIQCFPLYDEDIILLCSDGLSGVLRKREIETILSENTDTMENCRNALWAESEKAGWTDNVTIALCQVLSGTGTAPQTTKKQLPENTAKPEDKKRTMAGIIIPVVVLLLGMTFEIGHYVGTGGNWWLPAFGDGRHPKECCEKPCEPDESKDETKEQDPPSDTKDKKTSKSAEDKNQTQDTKIADLRGRIKTCLTDAKSEHHKGNLEKLNTMLDETQPDLGEIEKALQDIEEKISKLNEAPGQ